MIELRWQRIEFYDDLPRQAIPIQGQIHNHFKVLQYRVKPVQDPLLPEVAWSEWQDVPEVQECDL